MTGLKNININSFLQNFFILLSISASFYSYILFLILILPLSLSSFSISFFLGLPYFFLTLLFLTQYLTLSQEDIKSSVPRAAWM